MISKIQERIVQGNWEVMISKLLDVACGLVLVGILVAGLWPFHAPKNEVTWPAGDHGLRFGYHGTILSSGKFPTANASADAPCSLEIWVQPGIIDDSSTLFGFYASGNPRQFSVRQSMTDLALQSDLRKPQRARTTLLQVDNIFRRGKPSFVTVTTNGGKTSVYVDGVLARPATSFLFSRGDLAGELVVANSPFGNDSWMGWLRGLAFYDAELTPAQVSHHYETWTKTGRPDATETERPLALYLFDEGAGRIIHNHVSTGTDLYIPERYLVVDELRLQPFWEEFSPTRGYCKNVAINIAGFIPLGFLFYAYLSLAGRIRQPALVTILLGFMVSLTIEYLQAFLPTRDSGTTDIITNTLGTGLGVWFYRWGVWRTLLAKMWAHVTSWLPRSAPS